MKCIHRQKHSKGNTNFPADEKKRKREPGISFIPIAGTVASALLVIPPLPLGRPSIDDAPGPRPQLLKLFVIEYRFQCLKQLVDFRSARTPVFLKEVAHPQGVLFQYGPDQGNLRFAQFQRPLQRKGHALAGLHVFQILDLVSDQQPAAEKSDCDPQCKGEEQDEIGFRFC